MAKVLGSNADKMSKYLRGYNKSELNIFKSHPVLLLEKNLKFCISVYSNYEFIGFLKACLKNNRFSITKEAKNARVFDSIQSCNNIISKFNPVFIKDNNYSFGTYCYGY